MPQLSAISLKDRETVPVTHVFTPLDITNGVGTVVNSTGVPIGNKTLTISNRKAGGKYKCKLVTMVPIVQTQTINGVSTPVVVRASHIETNFTFDALSTTQERNNAMGLHADALKPDQVLVHKTVVDLEGVY